METATGWSSATLSVCLKAFFASFVHKPVSIALTCLKAFLIEHLQTATDKVSKTVEFVILGLEEAHGIPRLWRWKIETTEASNADESEINQVRWVIRSLEQAYCWPLSLMGMGTHGQFELNYFKRDLFLGRGGAGAPRISNKFNSTQTNWILIAVLAVNWYLQMSQTISSYSLLFLSTFLSLSSSSFQNVQSIVSFSRS